jgi:hypothetical protein
MPRNRGNIADQIYRAMIDTGDDLVSHIADDPPPGYDYSDSLSTLSYLVFVDMSGPQGVGNIEVVCYNCYGRAKASWTLSRTGLEKRSWDEFSFEVP